jgi:hypothetical protein
LYKVLCGPYSPFGLALEPVAGSARTITPSQANAIDEDNAAQHAPVIDTGLSVGLREEGLEARHLRLGQPEQVAHITARFFEP